jgi:sugar lactone lactonase YvrE
MQRTGLLSALVCLASLTSSFSQDPPIIRTVAGGGPDGVPLSGALVEPQTIFFDASGRLVIGTPGRVFRADASGLVRVVAGGGPLFQGGDGRPAVEAGFNNAFGVAADAAGNLIIADTYAHRIRRVETATGIISTIAGTGVETWSVDGAGGDPADDLGDGGPATAASLSYPGGVAVAPGGDLIIVDSSNHRVRRVDASTGIITTIAGTGDEGGAGDGGPGVEARLAYPMMAVFGPGGALYVADLANSRIRRLDMGSGLITTVAGNGNPTGDFDGEGGDPADDLGDGGPATAATLKYPWSVDFDAAGNLFVADTQGQRIRRVDAATGVITTVAGNGLPTGYLDGQQGDPIDDYQDGVPATSATLSNPTDIALDADGDILIADAWNWRIRRVDHATGLISSASGQGLDDGIPAERASISADAVATDPSGDTYTAHGALVRKISAADGIISTVAGCDGLHPDCDRGVGWPPRGTWLGGGGGLQLAVDAAGALYIAASDFGNTGTVWKYLPAADSIQRFAGDPAGPDVDGIPAADAWLGPVVDVALDTTGNLFILQCIADFPAGCDDFWGGTGLARAWVRRVDAATGIISTVAGGGAEGSGGDGAPALGAYLQMPGSLAVDAGGNLYIAERHRFRVRRIDAATGIITTMAGTGAHGFSGDGGPAAQAQLGLVQGIAVDAANGLLISDTDNGRVRRVDLSTGIITTVAGTGERGVGGDGGQATQARLVAPADVAAVPAGEGFLIAGDLRIRQVGTAASLPPTANAGADRSVGCTQPAGTPVSLDGSGSAAGGGALLSYEWTGPFPEGGGAIGGVSPTVTLPVGASSISLGVHDGLRADVDDVEIQVTTEVQGLKAPLDGLVLEGAGAPEPGRAYRAGRTISLKLALRCGALSLDDQDVAAPVLLALRRDGVMAPLPPPEPTYAFRFTNGGTWTYALPTATLEAGVYNLVIGAPDGRRWVAAFEIR